ncbi:MAG: hypothetical protein V3W44_00440 [Dehalococcoidales bacterium]
MQQHNQHFSPLPGKAIAGPLKGKQLTPIPHGDYFAFAWLVFKPKTEIYKTPNGLNAAKETP